MRLSACAVLRRQQAGSQIGTRFAGKLLQLSKEGGRGVLRVCLCELCGSVYSCTHWGLCAAGSAAQSAWCACTSLWMGSGVVFAARPRLDVYTIQQVWVLFGSQGCQLACRDRLRLYDLCVQCCSQTRPDMPCLAWSH